MKRFDCRRSNCYGMQECENGDYILYDDHEFYVAEVERLQCIIREFCAGQEFADKSWKEQKHIKTLFEEAGQM